GRRPIQPGRKARRLHQVSVARGSRKSPERFAALATRRRLPGIPAVRQGRDAMEDGPRPGARAWKALGTSESHGEVFEGQRRDHPAGGATEERLTITVQTNLGALARRWRRPSPARRGVAVENASPRRCATLAMRAGPCRVK